MNKAGGVGARVGAKELTALLTVFTATHMFLDYPSYVSAKGMEATWMEPLLSGIGTLILFLIVEAVLSRRFPGMDIIEVCKITFGRFAAILIALIFAVYFILVTASVVRQFTENVVTTVLPSTPIIVISILFLLTVGYTAYCGLEAIARTALIVLPVLIVGVFLICFFTMNWWQPQQLLPIWGAGRKSIIWGSIKYASIFSNILLLCIIYPHLHQVKSLRKVGVTSIVSSTLLLTAFLLAYHMVFPAIQTDKVSFPMYQLARMIYLGRFIQRLESLFIFLWVAAAVIKMAICLWAAAYTLSSALKWQTFRPAIPALGLIVWSISMLWENLVSAMKFDEHILTPYGGYVVFGLPLFIVLMAAIIDGPRRRHRRLNHA